MNKRDAENFYSEQRGKQNYQQNVDFLSSDLCVGMELIADNCVNKWNDLLGDSDPRTAKSQNPDSVRSYFG